MSMDPEVGSMIPEYLSTKYTRGKWGKADYLRNSMQYFFTECLYLTKDFYVKLNFYVDDFHLRLLQNGVIWLRRHQYTISA